MRDKFGALETFDSNRERIDRAASAKFEAGGIEDGLHEGQPIVMLRTDDLT